MAIKNFLLALLALAAVVSGFAPASPTIKSFKDVVPELEDYRAGGDELVTEFWVTSGKLVSVTDEANELFKS